MLIIRLWREEIKYGKPRTGLLKNRTVFIVWEHFWWFFHPVSSEVTIHGSHLRPHNSSDPTTFSMRVSLLCSSVVLLCFSLSRVCVCVHFKTPQEKEAILQHGPPLLGSHCTRTSVSCLLVQTTGQQSWAQQEYGASIKCKWVMEFLIFY